MFCYMKFFYSLPFPNVMSEALKNIVYKSVVIEIV